jgi:hypothetical protein
MPDSRQIKKPKKKASKKPEHKQEQPEKLSKEKKTKLKELDNYIENVLEGPVRIFWINSSRSKGSSIAPPDLRHRIGICPDLPSAR